MLPNYERNINNGDNGWIDATLQSGVTASSSGYGGAKGVQYKKIGNHVYVRGSVSCTWNGSDSIEVASLPYHPPYSIYFINPLTGSRIARIYIRTSGMLCIEWVRAISDGSAITSELSWIEINIDFFVD